MAGRFKDQQWDLADTTGQIVSWQAVEVAVLMDIRDELKVLNRLLGCGNFLEVPSILRGIKSNTAKPRAKKV